ncbi:MAG: phosphate-starvation-inducible PsiE family protein [bacterium]|nr:phosphate-starvation-inducible PsiE family protein [bacterium]
MRLIRNYEHIFTNLSIYFSTLIRFLLNILLIIIVIALIVGVYKTGYDLFTTLHDPLEKILQRILLDVVFIVALIEITITVLGYLKDGYVQVRYIVDTVLIIMLNEIVSLWFRQASLHESIGIAVIIAVLAFVRITAIKYAPTSEQKSTAKKLSPSSELEEL